MEAVAYARDEAMGIEVALNAPLNSLVFARRDDFYSTRVEILARLLTRSGRRVILEESWVDTVRVNTFEATQSFQLWRWQRSIRTDPGAYTLEIVVSSAESRRQTTRRQRVDVPDPRGDEPALLGIRMTTRAGDASYAPLAGLHLPADLDSLRAGIELLRAADGTSIEMTLFRFESDTAAAAAPFYFSPGAFSLARIGINVDQAYVVQRTARRLRDPVEHVSIIFTLPPLEPGAYTLLVEASHQGNGFSLRKERVFSVMPPEYPRVVTIDQMIDALAYIARDRELEHIRDGADEAERRARFDAFWGNLIPNRQEAASVMTAYYSRVEEANVLFSTYKEGWKTDRGMIYIVFGPPLSRQTEPMRELWRYSYAAVNDPDFIFARLTPPGLHPAYPNYLLNRNPGYERPWRRSIERWRDGRIP